MAAIKVVWALERAKQASYEEFRRRAVSEYGPLVLALHPSAAAVSVQVVDAPATRCDAVSCWWLEVGPDGRDSRAGTVPEEAARSWAELSTAVVGSALGWQVDEVVHWDELPAAPWDGATPGVQMIAFVARRPDLARAEFERRYRAHAAVAREHHPGIARYVQNFVRGPVRPDVPPIDAIAQLSFAIREDLAKRFYRDESSRAVVAADVARFLDRERSWSVVATERLLVR